MCKLSDSHIKILGGRPLLAYTIERALESKLLDTVMVSTEDEEIASIADQLGLKVPFMRPKSLAQDFSPSLDVVMNVLETYQAQDLHFDAVMILEPTNPFREATEIDECIKIFETKNSDSLITVKEVPPQYNPHWVFEENSESLLQKAIGDNAIIARRQILPKAYARDGSVYITKTEVILKKRTLFGEEIAFRVNTNPNQLNIDSIDDWLEAERIVELMHA
ncbi:MAG: acylneuraminate cytidylyltransferase family protein [bacterium]|nr:acylneuraminate cytidylyltransferase family protein [bacterium]